MFGHAHRNAYLRAVMQHYNSIFSEFIFELIAPRLDLTMLDFYMRALY
jgi:hypothetical protein